MQDFHEYDFQILLPEFFEISPRTRFETLLPDFFHGYDLVILFPGMSGKING